jgi:hypothetical protein
MMMITVHISMIVKPRRFMASLGGG